MVSVPSNDVPHDQQTERHQTERRGLRGDPRRRRWFGRRRYHSASDAPRSCAAARPAFGAVVGLDTVHQFHLPAKTHPAATKSGTAASGFSGVLQPRDLWSLYDMPSSDLGQGQTVGVFGVGESDSTIANLRLFEMREHLPK